MNVRSPIYSPFGALTYDVSAHVEQRIYAMNEYSFTMGSDEPFQGEPTNTREAIMRATFQALIRHGYAGISIQRIADEAGLSKGSFYNHYENKDDLLLAFLDFMLEQFRAEFRFVTGDDPVSDLNAILTHAIAGSPPPSVSEAARPEGPSSIGPFVELRAQAVNNEQYRARISNLDEIFAGQIAIVVQRGIDQGVFRDVNPDHAAQVLLTLVMGLMFRRSTAEELDADTLQTAIDDVLLEYLFVEDSS